MYPSRTPVSPVPAPTAAPTMPRPCGACGGPVRSKRVEARFCSGRCRMRSCRSRQREDLLLRISAAEVAVEQVREVLSALRAQAERM
jgi:hypothetical protein